MPLRLGTPGFVLVVATLLAACSEGPIAPPQGGADLRLLHATPDLGPIDVLLDGEPVILGVTYGHSSGLVEVPPGRQTLTVRAGGQVLGEVAHTFALDHPNYLVVAAGTPRFSTSVTPDTGSVSTTERANVRMVNVVGSNTSEPTLLDVKVMAPNPDPDSVITFGLDTKVASIGPLMYFDPGRFDFRFYPTGTTNLLTTVSFDVALGEKKAVVLERRDDGSYEARVVVER